MNKNVKSIFFVLTFIMLLVSVGAVCAADDADSTGTASDTSVSDAAAVNDIDSDNVAAEPVTTKSNDDKVDTKSMIKEDKNLKTATKTVDVNNYNELTTTINDAVKDADNDEYIITLNEGTYQITKNTALNAGTYVPNIIINANNQTLSGSSNTRYVRFNNGCNVTINDADISHRIQNYANNIVIINSNITNTLTSQPDTNVSLINSYINATVTNDGNMIFENSIINNRITNNGNLTIGDDTEFGEDFTITGDGQIIINNTSRIAPYLSVYDGDYTLENVIITGSKTNNGNLTIRNATLNASITNNGNLTICDDVTFGDNFALSGGGEIIINDTSRLIPYLNEFNGDYTLENMTITSYKTNNGNLTFKNCTISSSIANNGNMTLENTTINAPITNNGNLTIRDDCIIGGNFELYGNGEVFTNITEVFAGVIESLNGTGTYSNAKFKKLVNITGNVTLINCTLDSSYSEWGMTFYNTINNMGNLSLINCTLNCNMNNTGDMIIDGCSIPKGVFTSYGRLEIANVNWLNIRGSYSSTGPWENLNLRSDTLIRNSTFSSTTPQAIIYARTNNLTIVDCQFNGFSGQFQGSNVENSTLTIINSNMTNNQPTSKLGAFRNIENVYINNCSFENNTSGIIHNINNTFIDNCTFINNSYLSEACSNINVKNSIFKNHSENSIISVSGNCNISNCTFEDNTLFSNRSYSKLNGIAINAVPNGNKTILITENIFKNNYIDAVEGEVLESIYIEDYTRTGFGTDICIGLDYNSNNYTGNNSNIIISNNQFINSQTTQKAGAIFVVFNETCENNTLTIKENTFENIKAKSETIIYNNTQNVNITDNTFINCTIDLDEFTLSSPQDGLTITPDTPITLNIQSILSNPEYYDQDLLTKSGYQIFINNENKYNTTENEFTFTSDSYGTLNINVVIPEINNKTNDITVTVFKKELVINEIDAHVGDIINITAQIKINDEVYSQVSNGKISFKVNGKTLKDESGKVLYAKVTNGTATIENYVVPDDWAKEGSTIQAVYSGSAQFEKLTSEKTEITIEKAKPTLTTSDITANAGETITLTATINDNNKVINNGKIVFKINGKTVKDASGKVIYAKVVNNQVSVEYTLPADMKAKNYNITATFISSDYDRLEDTKVLTVA